MIKKIFFYLFLLAIAFPIYAKSKMAATDLDKIVAIVNSDVITQGELDKKMAMINRQRERSNTPMLSHKQVLDNMIYTLLQLQLAQSNGIHISESELDNIISKIAKDNHITIDQLRETLQEHEGLSFKEYREQLRDQLLTTQVQQRFLGREVVVNEQDIKKVLRNPPEMGRVPAQYHVIDILIGTQDNASSEEVEAAKNTAKQIIVKLKKGVSVSQIEQEYNSRVRSDDLGWRKTDELPALFVKEIIKMQKGQTIGPIKAPNGLHLIKLLEVQSARAQAAKFTKEQAREIAFRQKLEERLKPWLEELRKSAYVKIVD